MKLVQFGLLVLGAHLIGFVLIFVYPGCRSTPSGNPPGPIPTAASEPTAPPPVPAEETAASTTPPSPLEPSPFGRTPAIAGQVRLPPTRPGPGELDVPPRPPEFLEYVVRSGDSLWVISRRMNMPIDRITAANGISRSTTLQVGQVLRIPVDAAQESGGLVLPAQALTAAETATYTVRSGDSLSSIARRHGTTVAALRTVNGLTSDRIEVGQRLRLPADAKPLADAVSAPPASSAASSRAPTFPAAGAATTHVVRSGETIGAIARRYGVSAADILSLNQIRDPRRLRAGDTIRIPHREQARPAQAPAPPVTASEPKPSKPAAPAATETPVEAPPPVPADDVPVTPIYDDPDV